jgi:hypothetical protein
MGIPASPRIGETCDDCNVQILRDLSHLQNHQSESIDVIVCTARLLHKLRFGNTLAHQVMHDIDMVCMLDRFEQEHPL